MDIQVQNAIEIAWNPSSDQNLKSQAFEFLNQLRTNPEAWQICLALFIQEPRKPEVVRHFSLEVLNNSIQERHLDGTSLGFLKESFLDYVRRTYRESAATSESSNIQNKVAQCLTTLFATMYEAGWETFFEDLWQPAASQLLAGSTTSPATLLYLRVIGSVHDEIADIYVATTSDTQTKNTSLKDLVRVRDAARIAASWQETLSRWQRLDQTLTDLCLKTISKWVSWTDISLIVNQSLMDLVYNIAAQPEAAATVSTRNAAIDVFTEIVGKKMLPAEKVELIRFLNIQGVIEQLLSTPSLSSTRGTSEYDTDMAEIVAKLVNTVVLDLVKVLDLQPVQSEASNSAATILQGMVVPLLRFFTDEYDEVCSTVIPSLTVLLTYFRKLAKSKSSLPEHYASLIPRILSAIVLKMRYDNTSKWGEEDEETDEGEFQELRKRLKVLQQIVAAIDENLFLEQVGTLVRNTFSQQQSQGSKVNWRDLELALNELYLLGELGVRNGGLYQKKMPSSIAAEKLIELMTAMLNSGVAQYSHPAISLQYMELCVRYISFFEQHAQYIPSVLESFVSLVHSQHVKVKMRSWHLFLRFVRHLRAHLGNVSHVVFGAISDLLNIRAEVQEEPAGDDASSNQKSQSSSALFNSQLYLFEAIGCIASSSASSEEDQLSLSQSIIKPLMSSMSRTVPIAVSGNEQGILQVHHLIKAIGTFAQGFSEWVPGSVGIKIPLAIGNEFVKASEAILSAVESLKSSMEIRDAGRSAFSRMIGVLGVQILQQLPRWIDSLLSESSSKDEMAMFLRLMDQVIYGFKSHISDILDSLLTPLLQRIFAGFAEPAVGTDDEIQAGELRREYLGFLLCVLNNDLGAVFVSSANQGIFESIVSTIEHFAKDASEFTDARLALSVLTRMCAVWGGPDIPDPTTNSASPSPLLPSFDTFMMSRFSALTWTIMMNPDLRAKDPQANRLLGEIATLQQIIVAKTGKAYLSWLQDTELRNMGADDATIHEYLQALITKDNKSFKAFLLTFVGRRGN